MGNSCLTNAHLMLASFTMVFGYSWYLFIDECILSDISVRAVNAACFTTCHAMGTWLQLGWKFQMKLRVCTWTQDA